MAHGRRHARARASRPRGQINELLRSRYAQRARCQFRIIDKIVDFLVGADGGSGLEEVVVNAIDVQERDQGSGIEDRALDVRATDAGASTAGSGGDAHPLAQGVHAGADRLKRRLVDPRRELFIQNSFATGAAGGPFENVVEVPEPFDLLVEVIRRQDREPGVAYASLVGLTKTPDRALVGPGMGIILVGEYAGDAAMPLVRAVERVGTRPMRLDRLQLLRFQVRPFFLPYGFARGTIGQRLSEVRTVRVASCSDAMFSRARVELRELEVEGRQACHRNLGSPRFCPESFFDQRPEYPHGLKVLRTFVRRSATARGSSLWSKNLGCLLRRRSGKVLRTGHYFSREAAALLREKGLGFPVLFFCPDPG